MRNQLRGVFKRSFAFPSMSPLIELRDDLFRDSPSPQHSIASLKRMRNSPDEPVRVSKILHWTTRFSWNHGVEPCRQLMLQEI